MPRRDIIVIGGSSGSQPVLRQLLSDLPADMPASLFIATHMPSGSVPYLADGLSRVSKMPVLDAEDGLPIERGRVYVAVPDHHLLLIDGTIRFGDGPRENMARPSIDPLFRSAALSYGPRVVGVILSGMLNDGASGLSAIKACGGTAVVQHPQDATADQMPLAALETVEPDEVPTAHNLAQVLSRIAATDAAAAVEPSRSLQLEVAIAGGARLGAEQLRQIADPAALVCPDCNGVLSEVRDEQPLRYRCQIGHASSAVVLGARTGGVEQAMRIALRVMEERVTLVKRMAEDARRTGRKAVADLYEGRRREYERYAGILREAAIEVLHSRPGGARGDKDLASLGG